MILGEDNRKAWSQTDVLVMQAYQILETERCTCGHYKWVCHSSHGLLNWKVVDDVCDATAAVEEAREKRKDKDDHGVSLRAEPYMRDDSPLWKLRQHYYEQLAAEDDED